MKTSVTRGTPQQLLDAVKRRIAELGGDVEIEGATNSANIGATPILGAGDDYTSSLHAEVESILEGTATDITWDEDDENIYMTATVSSGDVFDYTIPKSDLAQTFDEIERDAQYIADAVLYNVDHPEEIEEITPMGLVDSATAIKAGKLYEPYVLMDCKSVQDSDGFWTDYCMYFNKDDGSYFFMFGDRDTEAPDPEYADWECETEEQAREWFDSYNGFEDEDNYIDDSIDSCSNVMAGCSGKKSKKDSEEKPVKSSQLSSDLSKYQEWVDYDMERYGKISKQTQKEIERAGLSIVKDDHGDYEVIS